MAKTTKHETNLVLKWNILACRAINYTEMPITLAARALAMVHTAMYDAWSVYSGKNEISTTTGVLLKVNKDDCDTRKREKAFSYAAYRVLHALFVKTNLLPEEHEKMFDELMSELKYRVTDTTIDVEKPQGIGNLSAKLILECRGGDLSNIESDYADYTGYEPVDIPPADREKYLDRWQPQFIDHKGKFQEFLTSHWGLVKPFALIWGGQYRPEAPIPCSSSRFRDQLEEAMDLNACLNDEQKMIAEYWAGMHEDRFTPTDEEDEEDQQSKELPYDTIVAPVLCCKIGRYIAEKNEFKNSNCIKLFFALTNTLSDTCIAVWDSKRHYDYTRPVSAIRKMMDDVKFPGWAGPCKGTDEIQGENWRPYYIMTPPFAEYVSSTSALMHATAEIITCFCGTNEYGDSIEFAPKSSKIESECTPSEKVTLEWETLHYAADQAGCAHRFGGINFEDADMNGRKLGDQVAGDVWKKVYGYLTGKHV